MRMTPESGKLELGVHISIVKGWSMGVRGRKMLVFKLGC